MADAPAFTQLVPGFDFLQGLVRNAGSALPSIGQWVAPTLDPDELTKRIEELRTVQFWLEQNARMLGATIQALEVQRMTLTTLRTMNVQMDDLTESLKIRIPEPSEAPPAPAPTASAAPSPAAEPEGGAGAAARPSRKPRESAAQAQGAGPVDPMQWWGALTRQFTELAASALKESAGDAGKGMAEAMIERGAEAGAKPKKAAGAASAARKAGGARKRAAPPKTAG